MTNEELFDKHMRSRGGRWARKGVSQAAFQSSYGHILRIADDLIGSARAHVNRLPDIHFDFVLNGSFNACAFKAAGNYFIGFYTGARYLLELIFFRMLSDARLFDYIGNASEERSDLAPLTGYAAHGEQMFQAGVYPSRPKNDDRWAYACDLLRRAIFFLVGHEIAHITRGHVDYLLSKTGSSFIPEVGWNDVGQDGAMERQAMEADADRRSATAAVSSAHLACKSSDIASGFMATRMSPEDLLFDWAFAINTVLRLFGDIRFNSDTAGRSSYPPMPLRRLIVTRTMHVYVVMNWGANLREIAAKALKKAALYSEIAFMTILGQTHGAFGLEVFGKEGVHYDNELLKFWIEKVSPRIAPFAYEPDRANFPSFADPADVGGVVSYPVEEISDL